MKAILPVLLSPILYKSIPADCTMCDDLNVRATALQSGDSCTLFNAIINAGDILAGDMAEVGTTCGVHLENVDYHINCVEEVVDVVAGIADEECEVTGGSTVENFIYAIDGNNEGLSLLSELACKGQGECYADLQRAIDLCNEDPSDEDCIHYATCDCLMEFLAVMEALSKRGWENFLKLDDTIIKKIVGTDCRCDDFDALGLSLELGPSCALSSKIVQDGDMFAGDTAALADTCDAANELESTCVEDVANVVDGFIEYGCPVRYSSATFIYSLHGSKEDFNVITDFACNNDCYSALKTCQNDNSCMESLSCECKRAFGSIEKDLSSDTKEDFLKMDYSTIYDLQEAARQCTVDTDSTAVTQPATANTTTSSIATEAPNISESTEAPKTSETTATTASTGSSSATTVEASAATDAPNTATEATTEGILPTDTSTGPQLPAPPQGDAAMNVPPPSSSSHLHSNGAIAAAIVIWSLFAFL